MSELTDEQLCDMADIHHNQLGVALEELLALRERVAQLEGALLGLRFYDPKDDWRSHSMDVDFADRVERKKAELNSHGDMLTLYINEGDWWMLLAHRRAHAQHAESGAKS